MNEQNATLDPDALIGIIGAGTIILGLFLPFMQFPFSGSVNYFAFNNHITGVIMLAAACGALAFLFLRLGPLVILTALGAAILTTYDAIRIFTAINDSVGQLDAYDNELLRGLSSTFSLSVGPFVIIAGAIIVILAGIRQIRSGSIQDTDAAEQTTFFCRKCNNPMEPGNSYCPKCGQEYEWVEEDMTYECSKCRADITPDQRFCPECGQEHDWDKLKAAEALPASDD